MKVLRPAIALVLALAAVAAAASPERPATLEAVLEHDHRLPIRPPDYAGDVAWLDGGHVAVATGMGVRRCEVSSGKVETLVPGRPLPEGVLDPSSLAAGGDAMLTFSLARLALSAWRADGSRVFAYRKPPGFQIWDIAVWRGRMAILGYPRDASGRMANPAGAAVWVGPLEPGWKKLWPLHPLHSEAALQRFPFATWPLSGALAVEPDGTLDVITAVEPGVYRYGPDGRLRDVLGRGLDELVGRRLRDVAVTYARDPERRYREIVNRQPWVNDLVATPDGPAIVVRRFADGVQRWELWYPDPKGVRAVVRLPYEIRKTVGWMRAEMHGDRLAAVVTRNVPREKGGGLEDHLLLFRVPRIP